MVVVVVPAEGMRWTARSCITRGSRFGSRTAMAVVVVVVVVVMAVLILGRVVVAMTGPWTCTGVTDGVARAVVGAACRRRIFV